MWCDWFALSRRKADEINSIFWFVTCWSNKVFVNRATTTTTIYIVFFLLLLHPSIVYDMFFCRRISRAKWFHIFHVTPRFLCKLGTKSNRIGHFSHVLFAFHHFCHAAVTFSASFYSLLCENSIAHFGLTHSKHMLSISYAKIHHFAISILRS